MRAMLTFGALLLLLCFGDVAAVASHNAAAPRSGSDRRALPTKTTFTRNNNTQKNPAVEKQVQNANKSVNLKHKDADNKEEIIPSILVGWLRLYRAIPTGLKIPFTKIDVSFTIASALFLACFDLLTAELLCSVMGWTKGSVDTRAVAGSLTTIFHGTILVFGLGTCLATQPYSPSGKMDDHPTWWQDAASSLIQLCTGYMLYDASVQFILDRWQAGIGPVLSTTDYLFLGHHAATSIYMTSARLAGAGHMSAMALMLLGECTAPIQNIFRISRITTKIDCMGCGEWMNILHPYIEYLFSLVYVFFRALVGPVCAVHLTYDLVFTKKGRENVPIGLSMVWLLMCWGVLLGSIPWIVSANEVVMGAARTTAFA